ncbi:hypothetical protein HC174_11325 [Salinimicrobium sp. CDJ15-81-2]|nr:hypothetical protein [Salinimicrobium nanhaiense]
MIKFAIPSLPQIFLLLILLVWMYFLYEIVTSEFKGKEGMLWALLVFFVPFVGVLAYLTYGRSSRMKKE